MPTEVQTLPSSCDNLVDSRPSAAMRRQGKAILRRLPTESILVSRDSPRRTRKLNVTFSTDLLLETSVRDGDLGEVRKLLKAVRPVTVNQQCTNSGVTILHQSVLNCDADMTQLLLDSGAFIETRDVDGWTPLHAAAAIGADACVKILLDAGADPYAKTFDSQESAMDLVDVSDQASVRCVKHLVAAMQRSPPQSSRCPSLGTRDSIVSLSSISTCSSAGSSLSGRYSYGCPSPTVLSAMGRSRSASEDSGIDCLGGTSSTPSPGPISPLCTPRSVAAVTTSRPNTINERPVPPAERASASSSPRASSSSSNQFRRSVNTSSDSNTSRVQEVYTDSDDSELESDRCGSVLASWTNSVCALRSPATSPITEQSGSDLSGDAVSDVDMVVSTGRIARRRRLQKQQTVVDKDTGLCRVVPHRRLSFV